MIDIDEIPKHKKKAPKRKPFVVEAKIEKFDEFDTFFTGEWFTVKRYTTLSRALQGMSVMEENYPDRWKFRIKPGRRQ